MMVAADSTNVTTYFVLRLAATGVEATGLTIANMDLQYVRSGAAPAAKVDAQALAATDTAHTDNFAIEIDATDQPGLYRVDWPDAAFAAGVREVVLSVKCATVFTEHLRVELTPPSVNVTQWLGTAVPAPGTAGVPSVDAIRISTSATAADNVELAGLAYSTTRGLTGTALPAAAADAAGGVPISDAGGLDLDSKLANTNEITVARMGALTDWINGGRLDLILDIIAADTTTDIPTQLAGLITTVGVAGAGLTAIDLPNQTMDITGNITGNLSGSVGSVTGAVGSVTGAVGSVTGAVGSIAAGGITAASFAANAMAAAGAAAAFCNKIADHILKRSYATARASSDGDAVAYRSLMGDVAKHVNKIDAAVTPGKLTVYHEDDSTVFGTQTLTTSGSALPVTVADTD